MYTYQLNQGKTEMKIFRNGQQIYKSGFHPSISRNQTGLTEDAFFVDCVIRIQNQLI